MFFWAVFFPSDNGGGWNVWTELMWTDWSALNESQDSFCEKPIWNVFIILKEKTSATGFYQGYSDLLCYGLQ